MCVQIHSYYMMTKDSTVASTAPSLVSMSPQGTVLVTLPSTATVDMGNNVIQGTVVKVETEEELSAGLSVVTSVPSSVSNGMFACFFMS